MLTKYRVHTTNPNGYVEFPFSDLIGAQTYALNHDLDLNSIESIDYELLNTDVITWVLTGDQRSIQELLFLPSGFWEDSKKFQIKQYPTVKGEQRLIEYYKSGTRNLDGTITYTDLAIKETNSWDYFIDTSVTPNKKYPAMRTTTLEYYLSNGQVGYTDHSTKLYDINNLAEITPVIERRHKNIIAEAENYLISFVYTGQIPYADLVNLLSVFSKEIGDFVSGDGQPLKDAIWNSNLSFLTQEMKNNLVGTTNPDGSIDILGILDY